jgi:ubiquinone/menaquinone biosynthesis C-methylase UbiE
MSKWNSEWGSTPLGHEYGQLFYRRATGELPEMESSKAAAKRILRNYAPGETILDVGCGAGHYLRSLRAAGASSMPYLGIDSTPAYVTLARKAFEDDKAARFDVGDIFALPAADRAYDVVMCNNVLLHLPSIIVPLRELIRVARRRILIRTLIGQTSYRVQDVAPGTDGDDFDESGEPRAFHFLNIYSEAYVRRLIASSGRVKSATIELDRDFDAARIADTGEAIKGAWDATRVVNAGAQGPIQISGALLMPWSFIDIALES